jgi:hypothetical protein
MSTQVSAETLKATASAMLSAYNTWTLEAILSDSWRSPSCITEFLPLSLGYPSMNNTQYAENLSKNIFPLFRDYRITFKDVIVDEKERKLSIWASSTAETDIGPCYNEYVFMIKCGEDGKAEWIGEFMDSKSCVDFASKLKEYLEKQGKNI